MKRAKLQSAMALIKAELRSLSKAKSNTKDHINTAYRAAEPTTAYGRSSFATLNQLKDDYRWFIKKEETLLLLLNLCKNSIKETAAQVKPEVKTMDLSEVFEVIFNNLDRRAEREQNLAREAYKAKKAREAAIAKQAAKEVEEYFTHRRATLNRRAGARNIWEITRLK